MGRDDEPRRIEVGFSGGQAIAIRCSQKAFESLRKAVQGGTGWYEVESADGPIGMNLGQIVFVKLEQSEHQVGFSGL